MQASLEERRALAAFWSRRGAAGAAARVAKQSPERRREVARLAARARWDRAGQGATTRVPDADLPDATDAALAACVRPVLAHPRTEARFQIATQTARRSGVAVGALVELVHHWPLLPEPVRAAIEDEPERLLGPAVPLLLAIVRRYTTDDGTR